MKHVLLRYSCTDSKSEDPQSKTWISGSLTRLFLVSQVVSRLKHLIHRHLKLRVSSLAKLLQMFRNFPSLKKKRSGMIRAGNLRSKHSGIMGGKLESKYVERLASNSPIPSQFFVENSLKTRDLDSRWVLRWAVLVLVSMWRWYRQVPGISALSP